MRGGTLPAHRRPPLLAPTLTLAACTTVAPSGNDAAAVPGETGRNAILVTHGFTSSHHAAGTYTPGDAAAGAWDGLIGPGKAIDTTRYFVVSSNMLGSSYGSTAPRSTNAATGKPYGPDFPDITVHDTTGDFGKIRARVLYVLSRTDKLFPRGSRRR